MRKLNLFFLVILGIWGAVNTWLRGTSALVLAQNGVVFSLRVSSHIWAIEASRACHSRVYFSRYPPSGELARRLLFK